jgi:hypothetical protein
MSRLPRICVPDCPHHVTARGNRREPIFFEDGDQDIYCDMLAEQMRKANVEVWAQRIKQTMPGSRRCARRSRPGDRSDRLTLSKGSNAFSNTASRDALRDKASRESGRSDDPVVISSVNVRPVAGFRKISPEAWRH